MFHRIAFLAAAIAVATPQAADALDPQRVNSQYVISKWGGSLPSASIHALAQTPDHYLWLGTPVGPVRFDGADFTVFDAHSAPAFTDGGVARLAVGQDGSLYLGTTSGTILRFSRDAFMRLGDQVPVGTSFPSSLLAARDGSLWIGLPGHAVRRWYGGQVSTFAPMRSMQAPLAMTEDPEGRIWIGTRGQGLMTFDHGNVQRQSLTNDSVQALRFDHGGALWIGTPHGLLRFQGGRIERFTRRNGLSHDDVSVILEDRDRNLWVGTSGGGLNRLSHGQWTHLTSREGLSDNDIRCLLEDHEGNLWVGTADGLNCLSDGRFITYGRLEGLREPAVSAVAAAAQGGAWLGLASGQVARLRNGTIERIDLPPGVGREAILALHEMRDGSLWLAQDNARVFRLQRGVITEHTPRGVPEDEKVRAFFEDDQGPIFLVAVLGPARIREGRFVPMAPAPRPGLLRYPHAALRDSEGTLWVCDLHGLARLKDGQWRLFTSRDGLPSNRARWACAELNPAAPRQQAPRGRTRCRARPP